MKVFSSDNDGVGHFRRMDDTGEYATADRNISGEWALLIDVRAIDSLCGKEEGQHTSKRLLVKYAPC